MEVFLSNVPPDLGDRHLWRHLKPCLDALHIYDWDCSTSRRQNFGFVYFLSPSDAYKFMNKHGTLRFMASGSLGQPISVRKSKKPIEKYMLWNLERAREERLEHIPKDKSRTQAANFELACISCGHISQNKGTGQLGMVAQCSLGIWDRGKVQFSRKLLLVRFEDIMLRIHYQTISHIIVDPSDESLIVVLNEGPRIYEREKRDGKTIFHRCTSIPSLAHHSYFVSYCLVYRLTVSGPSFASGVANLRKRDSILLHQENVPLVNSLMYNEDFKAHYDIFQRQLSALDRDRALPLNILFLCQELVWNNYLHPSPATKLVLSIASAYDKVGSGNRKQRGANKAPISAESMKQLFDQIPYPFPGMPANALSPKHLMAQLLSKEARCEGTQRHVEEVGQQRAWIFRAIVTPTRILLQGPDLEVMNRVLRKFAKHADCFMRVTFAEENGEDLMVSYKISNDRVFNRFRKIMRDGIQVAGRVYTFLGFSHSSLRSHSAWFSTPFIDSSGTLQTYELIIQSLGDFENIRIPAKCAARIGQAFSETPSFLPLREHDISVEFVPDVTSSDGKRVFSDGVGKVSIGALQAIWTCLPQGNKYFPTCLQIRWAGAKGMLALDTSLKGRVIQMRESMQKFLSNDTNNLEICDTASKPIRMVLNRQLIKILEDMGVPETWFIDLQRKEIDRLKHITSDVYNAATFLDLQVIGAPFYLPTFIKSMDKIGIDMRLDSFMKAVIEATVLRELRLVKHKARIPVPKGVTLFGVLDETGFLKEGEVYVCYDLDGGQGRSPMDTSLEDGPILITRSPALHPGDIQLVTMRTPPPGHPLRNLRNCIVFNQHGERDLPSMLSGGDLDGDIFMVIWDPKATNPQRTYFPADYGRVTPTELDRKVTRDDMAEFFFDFIQSDILGMIAIRHMIVADQQETGTVHRDSAKLAELHSTAVDFSKTGIPVEISELPRTASHVRPDFLSPAPLANLLDSNEIQLDQPEPSHPVNDEDEGEGENDGEAEDVFQPNRHFYKSKKILGTLYRNVDERMIWSQDVRREGTTTSSLPFWRQFRNMVEGRMAHYVSGKITWEHRMEDAWRLREIYEDGVTNAMHLFSDNYRKPLTEVEVFGGFIFNKTGSQTRRQKDNSKKLKEEFDRVCRVVVSNIRRQPESSWNPAFSSSTIQDPVDHALAPGKEALELSWACFLVGLLDTPMRDGYGEEVVGPYGASENLQSFKVIAASCFWSEWTGFLKRLNDERYLSQALGRLSLRHR